MVSMRPCQHPVGKVWREGETSPCVCAVHLEATKPISVSEEWRDLDFFSSPFYSSAFSHALLLSPLKQSSESSRGNSPLLGGGVSAGGASDKLMYPGRRGSLTPSQEVRRD